MPNEVFTEAAQQSRETYSYRHQWIAKSVVDIERNKNRGGNGQLSEEQGEIVLSKAGYVMLILEPVCPSMFIQ